VRQICAAFFGGLSRAGILTEYEIIMTVNGVILKHIFVGVFLITFSLIVLI